MFNPVPDFSDGGTAVPELNAPWRKRLKPVLSRLLGERAYRWLHYRAKIRDIKFGLVREAESDIIGWFTAKDSEAIDVGANFGYYAVPLSRLCSKVFAFEPIPATHDSCRKILRHFKARNVELFPYGVGREAGSFTFEVPVQENGTPSAGQARLAGRNDVGDAGMPAFSGLRRVDCPVVALGDPDWIGRFRHVTYVKLDIEGAELFALRGMRALLARFRPVVQLEICPAFLKGFGVSEEDIRAFGRELEYTLFAYDAASGTLRPAQEPVREGNYFFLNGSHVSRLRSAGRIGGEVGEP